ncbi:MAG TPA: AMP-binding protein [Acidimicrobiales bacterium]|nr:AMP-binding protein [Acidimicrobiales bacterium]
MALMPIGAAIRWLAERDPGRPSITQVPVPGAEIEQRTITRVELELHTNKLARTYEALGVKEGDLVTIGLPNGIAFYEAAIATWKLGAIPQPVSYRLPDRELQEIVELATPSLVVMKEIVADPDASDEPLLPDRTSPSQKAPTSGGSTGRPKIILSGTPGVTDPETVGLGGMFGAQLDGVQLVPGPLYHNGPFVFSTGGLFVGQHLVVMPKFDAASMLRYIDEFGVDFAMLVPTMMTRALKLPDSERQRWSLASLRGILHLAAPCPPATKEAWIDWIGADKVWELYAGTEAQGVTIVSGVEWAAHRGTIGKPADGTMKVLSPEGVEVPRGEVGEIWMKPPDAKTYSYIGAEARVNAEGWESLGDMGWMDDDGYLYIADRRTDLILAGGANIYPAEVEAALDEHPLVSSCAVIGLPDEDLGQRVHALVHLLGDVSDDELRAFLGERLARYKVPRSFERTDGPVRDDAGKVRRSALVQERAEG